MAVTSIRVANAASGNRIQAIDAVELDSGSNATTMERVVVGSLKGPSVLGTALRGSGAAISAAETTDLTSLPADLTGNLITVGDASLLVVMCEMTSASSAYIAVTPIVFDDQATPVVIAPLETKTFALYTGFRRGSGSGNYVAPLQWWDCRGAYKIGLHVTALSSANSCLLWGYVI